VIDSKAILTDFEASARRLARKGVELEYLQRLRDLLEKRRASTHEVDGTRRALNNASEQIGRFVRDGKSEAASARRSEVAQLKQTLASLEEQQGAWDRESQDMLLRIPNFPSDDAPHGTTESDNVVLSVHQYDADKFSRGTYRPHWETWVKTGSPPVRNDVWSVSAAARSLCTRQSTGIRSGAEGTRAAVAAKYARRRRRTGNNSVSIDCLWVFS
jgi:seryl-tRNA synthetase